MRGITYQVLRLSVAALAFGACAPHEPRAVRQSPLDEITALFADIREWRREACLPTDPREDEIGFAPTRRSTPHLCSGQANPNNELCMLAEATCDNAEAICLRADELGDHLWAHEKCTSAKGSCRDTQELCCASMDAPMRITDCDGALQAR